MFYRDLYKMDEDNRIFLVGQTALEHPGQRIALILEKNEPDKQKRYVRKIKKKFPGLTIQGPYDGPVELCVTFYIFKPIPGCTCEDHSGE